MLHGILLSGYVELIDWLSRLVRPGEVNLTANVPDILTHLRIDTGIWQAALVKLIRSTK